MKIKKKHLLTALVMVAVLVAAALVAVVLLFNEKAV